MLLIFFSFCYFFFSLSAVVIMFITQRNGVNLYTRKALRPINIVSPHSFF